jgi:hypothetical protein
LSKYVAVGRPQLTGPPCASERVETKSPGAALLAKVPTPRANKPTRVQGTVRLVALVYACLDRNVNFFSVHLKFIFNNFETGVGLFFVWS